MTNSRQQASAHVKDRFAVDLRARGASYPVIADQVNAKFGTNHSADYIARRVQIQVKKLPVEGAETARAIEADRLDTLVVRLLADFTRPTPDLVVEVDPITGKRARVSLSPDREDKIMNTRARLADSIIRVSDRRARLLGFDAPPAEAAPVAVTVGFDPALQPHAMAVAAVEVDPEPGE